jgi:hypothetical protein
MATIVPTFTKPSSLEWDNHSRCLTLRGTVRSSVESEGAWSRRQTATRKLATLHNARVHMNVHHTAKAASGTVGKHHPTGCFAGEDRKAQEFLAAYIAEKYSPERRLKDIESIDVADVLSVYDEDCREPQANKVKFDERLARLAGWWGGKMLADVTGSIVAHIPSIAGMTVGRVVILKICGPPSITTPRKDITGVLLGWSTGKGFAP